MKTPDIEVRLSPGVRAIIGVKYAYYAAMTLFAVAAVNLAIDADRAIKELPAQINKQAEALRMGVSEHVDKARDAAIGAVKKQGDALRVAAIAEIHGTRGDINVEAGAINEIAAAAVVMADKRADAALKLANYHAAQIEGDLDDFNGMFLAVAKPARQVLGGLAVAEPALLKDEQQIADNLTVEIPKITVQAELIEKHLDLIATGIDALIPQKHHVPFWLRLFGVGR